MGVLDVLLSLACIAMSARESCGFQTGPYDGTLGIVEGHDRKERLYKWLGQQKHVFQNNVSHSKAVPSHFVPLSSSGASSSDYPSRRKIMTRFPSRPERLSQPSTTDYRRSRTPSNNNSSVVLIHPQHPENTPNGGYFPPPNFIADNGPMSLPSMLPVHPNQMSPAIFAPTHRPSYGHDVHQGYHPRQHNRQRSRQRSRSRSRRRIDKTKRLTKKKREHKKKPLTDEQIERTYTGLDREIAEGFISFAMEPALSNRKSASDNDSF